ncbi:hypothetical protein T492DRAFT_961449 [Pavlovales sp. CCMP2436]|nr:hypothetical protein T492DRAFT_961449 [Pavlovales sp. CCMP2436]|mmetsp:Transcript_35747/g.89025  ORF Transcript_35747/g.89025 Transcript_35747/m.89025 type:complete len:344 (+) Transcript_35747:1-1032(+)
MANEFMSSRFVMPPPPLRDPYATGTGVRTSHAHSYKSIAATSWTPKELAGRLSMASISQKQAPTASKVQYLSSASDLNASTHLRHGSHAGLTGPNRLSMSASAFTWSNQSLLSRPPSAVLERMYNELMAPVTQKSLDPFFAPIPSDLSRALEEHGPRSQAAIAQHRLRTRVTSRHIPMATNGSIDSRLTTVNVPSALGETGYTKSGPIYLRDADGGRKVLLPRYPDDAAPPPDSVTKSTSYKDAWPVFEMKPGVQVPGSGYRPRTTEDFSTRALVSLDGRELLASMRRPAPDHLRRPDHPRRKVFGALARPDSSTKLRGPPNGYVLISDDYEKNPFARTSKLV